MSLITIPGCDDKQQLDNFVPIFDFPHHYAKH
jgi:hypothetical protein